MNETGIVFYLLCQTYINHKRNVKTKHIGIGLLSIIYKLCIYFITLFFVFTTNMDANPEMLF